MTTKKVLNKMPYCHWK